MHKKLLWLLTAATVAVILFTMFQRKGSSSPEPTAFPPPRQKAEKVAAIPPLPKAEELALPPSPAPKEWRVLFTAPRIGKGNVLRSTGFDIFFNVPVKRDVAEWAFTISPAVAGTFSWPRADHLVFTPQEALLPATEYTVSLNSTSGSRRGEEYELFGGRWSFTTGEARTYDKDIRPLVAAYCTNCHGPNGSAAGIPLDTYREIIHHIVPGRSRESRFYTFIQDRQHLIRMAGPNHSTNDKLAVIRDWIEQDGATE